MLASTPHLAHSEQLPVRTWVSLMLCSEIPEYPTGHPGNNLGDKGSKALHDCYWVIQNFFSHSQSSTHPARHFPLQKEGRKQHYRQTVRTDTFRFSSPFFQEVIETCKCCLKPAFLLHSRGLRRDLLSFTHDTKEKK